MRKKILYFLLGTLLLLFLLLNLFAYQQAYHFCHLSDNEGNRTHAENLLTWKEKAKLAVTGINNPKPKNTISPSLPHDTVFIQSNVKLEGWLLKQPFYNVKGTVILFPGYMASKSYILRRAEEFYKLDYRVLMVDFMGAGGSEGNICTVGYKEAQNVKDSYDFIQKKYPNDSIYLFGSSMGAAAILKACKDYPEMKVSGIILECPFATLKQAIYNRCELLHIPGSPATELLMFWGGIQADFAPFQMNPMYFAKSVKSPTLLLYGAKDDRVKSWELDSIFQAIPIKEKKLVTFAKAGHDDFMSRERANWRKEVGDFLRNN